MYKILETNLFNKKFNKLIPLNYKSKIKRIILDLRTNPVVVGKPLGYKFLRELKIDKYRIYYLVYSEVLIVLLVSVSNKKTQQQTIDLIKKNLTDYLNSIKNISLEEKTGGKYEKGKKHK